MILNRLVTTWLLAACMGVAVLSGCGDKADAAPSLVGTWAETERITTTYDAQNQAQAPFVQPSPAGQLLVLRADGTYTYTTRLDGAMNGTYATSGATYTATRIVPNASPRTFTLTILEVTATALRLEEVINRHDLAGNPIRSLLETRYVRK